ncbi:hypothetical protein [Streptomyces sp. NPDC047000]|uniref:hypothetical protein n=1 Tax=Streptomyces sp. NPDC047000 TaxID=3155474 RepID=UPI0033BFFC06
MFWGLCSWGPGRRAACGGTRRAASGCVAVLTALLSAFSAAPAGAAGTAGVGGTYAYAPGAHPIGGATAAADAATLEPGTTYRSSISKGGKVYYRLDLDATTTTYTSVTAIPPAGATVSATDGIKVSMQDASGGPCSFSSASYGAGGSPRPVTALAAREVAPGKTLCRTAGTYYVVVERRDSSGSSPDDWGLELWPVSEPPLETASASSGTGTPGSWDSSSPEPVTGEARTRGGGSGYSGARALGPGVWRVGLRPGQTLFYKVPVDWGQQLSAEAELSDAADGHGYVSGALDLDLDNPARGPVTDAALGYSGVRKAVALDPLPPVGYGNRQAVLDQVSGMRFAGSYYLVVHLGARMADSFGTGPFEVTLRVGLRGSPASGPAYDGAPVPSGVFEVSARDREAAAAGTGGTGGTGTGDIDARDGRRPAPVALAAGGIGAGTALLLGLGVWTVIARRRAARVP